MQRPVCPRCRTGVKSGLRRQISKDETKLKIGSDNIMLAESIDRRRKIFNEYYLKKRKKRLDKLQNSSEITKTVHCNKTKKSQYNIEVQELESGEQSETSGTVCGELPANGNVNTPQSTVDNVRKFFGGFLFNFGFLYLQNTARLKAVEAALRRLELSKQEN